VLQDLGSKICWTMDNCSKHIFSL